MHVFDETNDLLPSRKKEDDDADQIGVEKS